MPGLSPVGGLSSRRTRLWFLAVTLLLAAVLPSPLVAARPAHAATQLAVGPLPLHTSGRYVMNAAGARVKLDGVNWYGADLNQFVPEGLEIQPLATIARNIRFLGFNVVRLPFSNQMVEQNPVVSAQYLKANPSLVGKTALQIFDATIDALAAAGLAVIIDDHTSTAQWCCNTADGNGLWWTAQYPESSWIKDWQTMAARYSPGGVHPQPAVVGAELRNEIRNVNGVGKAVWDGSGSKFDWASAATRGGNAVLAINPSWLIVVDGITFSLDLRGAATHPIVLNVPNRVVYAAHDYVYAHHPGDYSSFAKFEAHLTAWWGYLIGGAHPAPVWVNEFGTIATTSADIVSTTPSTTGYWFSALMDYLKRGSFDWAVWPINGTYGYSTRQVHSAGSPDPHGVLASNWASLQTDEVGQPLLYNTLRQLF
jgi:endoglucanase